MEMAQALSDLRRCGSPEMGFSGCHGAASLAHTGLIPVASTLGHLQQKQEIKGVSDLDRGGRRENS